MSDRLRVAIVGTGGISRSHARAIKAYEDKVELVAAVDLDPDRVAKFCEEWAVPNRYHSIETMLAEQQPDLVHVCTPPGAHLEPAITAMRAGSSVICEKPPCLSLADFDKIAAVEQETGRHFITIFQHRFGPTGRYVRDLINAGRLGRPLVAICNTLWYRPDAYYEPEWRGRWATEGGGPTMGHGVHQIDLLAHLLGGWEELVATAAQMARRIETEDVSFAHITFESGAIASVVNSILSPREESYLRFDFSEATVELTHLYGYEADNWSYTPVKGVEPVAWPAPGPDMRSSHTAQLGDVLERLANGEVPEASSRTARRTMEIITAIYASAFTGERIRRDQLVPGHPYYDSLYGHTIPYSPKQEAVR